MSGGGDGGARGLAAEKGDGDGVIRLMLLLHRRLVYGDGPASVRPSVAAAGDGGGEAASLHPSLLRRAGGVATRLSFDEVDDAVAGDSFRGALLHVIREDLKDAIGRRHTTTAAVTPTADASSPLQLTVGVAVWPLERGGRLTVSEATSQLAAYVGRTFAFPATLAFIGRNMRPPCMLAVHAAGSALNGVPLVALKGSPADEAGVAMPTEIAPLLPLASYRHMQLQGGSRHDIRASYEGARWGAFAATPSEKERRCCSQQLQRPSFLFSFSSPSPQRGDGGEALPLQSQRKPSASPSSPDLSLLEAKTYCSSSLSSSLQPAEEAAAIPFKLHTWKGSPPSPARAPKQQQRQLPPQQEQERAAPQRPIMKRARVDIVSHVPDPLGLVVPSQLLLTPEVVLAVRDDIIGQALMDLCTLDNVGLTVTVKHDSERMRNGSICAASPSSLSPPSSPAQPRSFPCATLQIAVDVPRPLELVAISALVDHLLGPGALAEWLRVMRIHVGELFAPQGLDLDSTYVNNLPLRYIEGFLQTNWGTRHCAPHPRIQMRLTLTPLAPQRYGLQHRRLMKLGRRFGAVRWTRKLRFPCLARTCKSRQSHGRGHQTRCVRRYSCRKRWSSGGLFLSKRPWRRKSWSKHSRRRPLSHQCFQAHSWTPWSPHAVSSSQSAHSPLPPIRFPRR
ncbi:uncharacterized protein Tco025E_02572 [Trypanosoma conorhini]|uniref:Uncharacterized protein n=1 Tax=Trypanosoma conorhini TaxID=83891 RepID=A0A422Q2U0_9TRYP|nr:uncharacterized protein Tco025E_02572 [Trypanosoma conorhini]RNF24283.1 hypothetical protein Tco025E_02572 [Trypanosoma conorhini]